MGKIIKMRFPIEQEWELAKQGMQNEMNLYHLKALVDKYIPTNKRFVINKIKKEQNF